MEVKCNVLLCDGIGNVIQSIPFIKEMRKHYKKVIGVDRADFVQTKTIVEHLFDEIVPLGKHDKKIPTYSIPPLYRYKSYPEYKGWFRFHNIPEPEEFKIDLADVKYNEVGADYDVVLWGGCKPEWLSKRWPYWGELAELLVDRGLRVAVVGADGDGGDFPSNLYDFRGQLSLLTTGGVIHHSRKYIGNEGGITHYANALQSDMYVIWGGTDPVKNMPPPREGYHSIVLGLDCQPCQWTVKSPREGCAERRCLYDLIPEIVYNSAFSEVDEILWENL